MIYLGQTYAEGNKPSRHYDEAWSIMLYPTRGLKHPPQHHPELAPSKGLYSETRRLMDEGAWGLEAFKDIYVPRYIAEHRGSARFKDAMNYLFKMAAERNIILMCSCADGSLCHRSIVGGLLDGALSAAGRPGLVDGAPPEGGEYYRMWKARAGK